jgi:hypothetical protein
MSVCLLISSSLLIKSPVFNYGDSLLTLLTLNHLPKAPSPNIIVRPSFHLLNTSQWWFKIMVKFQAGYGGWNPSKLGDRYQEDHGLRPAPVKNSQDFISTFQQKRLGVVACTCYLSYCKKHKLEDCSPSQPGQKARPCLKIARAKRAGGVVQMLKHLPHKCKTLSSTPNTAKKRWLNLNT